MFELILNTAAIEALIHQGARDAVNDTVDAIVPIAQELAPVDKGALEASIYAVKEGDDQRAAASVARNNALSANTRAEMLDGLVLEDLSDEGVHQAGVDVLASYGSLIHNGYSSASGRPFLEEAGEQGKPVLAQKLSELGQQLDS